MKLKRVALTILVAFLGIPSYANDEGVNPAPLATLASTDATPVAPVSEREMISIADIPEENNLGCRTEEALETGTGGYKPVHQAASWPYLAVNRICTNVDDCRSLAAELTGESPDRFGTNDSLPEPNWIFSAQRRTFRNDAGHRIQQTLFSQTNLDHFVCVERFIPRLTEGEPA